MPDPGAPVDPLVLKVVGAGLHNCVLLKPFSYE